MFQKVFFYHHYLHRKKIPVHWCQECKPFNYTTNLLMRTYICSSVKIVIWLDFPLYIYSLPIVKTVDIFSQLLLEWTIVKLSKVHLQDWGFVYLTTSCNFLFIHSSLISYFFYWYQSCSTVLWLRTHQCLTTPICRSSTAC